MANVMESSVTQKSRWARLLLRHLGRAVTISHVLDANAIAHGHRQVDLVKLVASYASPFS
jgi:hypothetical protein